MKNTLKLATAALIAAGTFTQPASAAGIKALILGDYSDDGDAAVKADLIGSDARFDQAGSSSYDLKNGLPDQNYLSQFDSVLVFTDNLDVDGTSLSDLLGNYAKNGGGVVITTFWGQEVGSSGGLLNSTGYNPLTNPTFDAYSSHTLGAYNPTDPLMQGVSKLASSQYNGDYLDGLDAGATLAASWDDGRPLAAYNANHHVVAITLNPNVVSLNHATGDYRQLFANGLAFAAGANVAAVPEPATWAMMIAGFGLVGAATRRRVRATVAYA